MFHGPPGTGKSALAKHIAGTLEMKCRLTKANGLLNSFVGGAEKRVNGAFQKTQQDEAVLIIDETDSFLFDRNTSVCSWETSAVNQFLICLEECRSICVCTANRLEMLDPAAIRRFSRKVEFTYPSQVQLRSLCRTPLSPLAGSDPDDNDLKALDSMTITAPGDFHAVKAKYWLAAPGALKHSELIGALAQEEKLKKEDFQKRVGFQ
ncbi:MAG: ATP-binding protein [Deltaproteobacteria bacterium]|nr:ATP-binding protein [Deltaproteobacteria bacterium]